MTVVASRLKVHPRTLRRRLADEDLISEIVRDEVLCSGARVDGADNTLDGRDFISPCILHASHFLRCNLPLGRHVAFALVGAVCG